MKTIIDLAGHPFRRDMVTVLLATPSHSSDLLDAGVGPNDCLDLLCERGRHMQFQRDATGALRCERVVRLQNINGWNRVYERRVRRSGLRRRETVCHRWNVDYDYDYDDVLDDINIRVWPTVDDYLSGRRR